MAERMDGRRPTVMHATLVAGVLFLTALFSSGMQSRRDDCSIPTEPPHALDLDRPADREHLAADLSLIERTATRYSVHVGAIPSASGIHATLTARSRPERAYRYCVSVLTDRVAKLHHLDPAALTH